jgi:hypothetical protein
LEAGSGIRANDRRRAEALFRVGAKMFSLADEGGCSRFLQHL